MTYSSFSPHSLKQGNNENSHYLYYHPPKQGDCHRNHYISSLPCGRKYREQGNYSYSCCHHSRTYAFFTSHYNSFPNIMNSGWFLFLKHLMNISTHYYTIVCGDAEKGNKSNPDRHAKVNCMHLEHVAKV